MTINLPAGKSWRMAGTMNLQGPAFGYGNAIVGSPVKLAGITTVAGANVMKALTTFEDGSNTTILTGGFLRLDGGDLATPNEIAGGTISGGNGTLTAAAGHALVGHGTIYPKINFAGDAEIIAKGGLLTISSPIIDVGTVGTADGAAILNFGEPFNTSVGTLYLKGGQSIGDTLTNGYLILGFGRVGNVNIVNPGTIAAAGGELVLDPFTALDLDGQGVSTTGVLNALAGDLRITKSPIDLFDGTAHVGAGHKLQLDDGGYVGTGSVYLTGGAQPATLAGEFQETTGTIHAFGDARLDMYTDFQAGASVTVTNAAAQLTLQKDAVVRSGVSFSGAGRVVVAAGANLTPMNGASIDVLTVNGGVVRIANDFSAGSATFKAFQQTTTGRMNVDLLGVTAGSQFDRTIVTTSAELDGKLALAVANYMPQYLVAHEILHAITVSGHFASILGVQLSPTKYLAVTYAANAVYVSAALPGDANLDGSVEFSDLVSLAQNYDVSTGGIWAHGDFNGDGAITFADLVTLAQNYGSALLSNGAISVDPTANFDADWAIAQSLVPEPGALSASLFALTIAARRGSRHGKARDDVRAGR